MEEGQLLYASPSIRLCISDVFASQQAHGGRQELQPIRALLITPSVISHEGGTWLHFSLRIHSLSSKDTILSQ